MLQTNSLVVLVLVKLHANVKCRFAFVLVDGLAEHCRTLGVVHIDGWVLFIEANLHLAKALIVQIPPSELLNRMWLLSGNLFIALQRTLALQDAVLIGCDIRLKNAHLQGGTSVRFWSDWLRRVFTKQDIYEAHVAPKLNSNQSMVLVPGAFASTYNKKCSSLYVPSNISCGLVAAIADAWMLCWSLCYQMSAYMRQYPDCIFDSGGCCRIFDFEP